MGSRAASIQAFGRSSRLWVISQDSWYSVQFTLEPRAGLPFNDFNGSWVQALGLTRAISIARAVDAAAPAGTVVSARFEEEYSYGSCQDRPQRNWEQQ